MEEPLTQTIVNLSFKLKGLTVFDNLLQFSTNNSINLAITIYKK